MSYSYDFAKSFALVVDVSWSMALYAYDVLSFSGLVDLVSLPTAS